MRILIGVLKFLVIVALCVVLFLWVAVHAGGHKVPAKTDWSFGLSSVLLLIVLLTVPAR